MLELLSKCFYLLAPIFVVSTKCIDPWVLEFMVSNIIGDQQMGKLYFVGFFFRGLSEPQNQRKLVPHD